MNTEENHYIRTFELELERRLQEKHLNYIQVLIGPRQVGKSSAVKNIAALWPQGKSVFINADSPSPKSYQWLKIEWQRARDLGDGALIIVDEIQKVDGWAEAVKELFEEDRRKLKVVLLGSASLSIQEGLSNSLLGRFELIKAHHWNAKECYEAFNWDFDTYLKFGGYPGARHLVSNPERWKNYVLDSIIEPVLGRDILGLVRISKPALFRQTFSLVCSLPGQVVAYNKILGQLQQGGNIETIKSYLNLLEGAYLIKQLEKFSKGAVKRKISSPKILILNPALANVHASESEVSSASWRGRILECVAGTHLLSLPGKLYYWSEGDYEVDFVREYEDQIIAYEIKTKAVQKTNSLEQFLKKYPKAQIQIWDQERVMQEILGLR